MQDGGRGYDDYRSGAEATAKVVSGVDNYSTQTNAAQEQLAEFQRDVQSMEDGPEKAALQQLDDELSKGH